MDETMRCPNCEQEVAADEPACPACGHIHSGGPQQCARHPDRQAKGVCVFDGDPVCEECNRSEPHFSCPEHRSIPVIEGWAQVYTTSDDVEADLIKENLQSEGIDAAVLSQKDRSFAVDLGDLSAVRILVPAYEYLEAVAILGQHMDARGEVVFACPSCGEAFEPGEATCRTCGAALPTVAG